MTSLRVFRDGLESSVSPAQSFSCFSLGHNGAVTRCPLSYKKTKDKPNFSLTYHHGGDFIMSSLLPQVCFLFSETVFLFLHQNHSFLHKHASCPHTDVPRTTEAISVGEASSALIIIIMTFSFLDSDICNGSFGIVTIQASERSFPARHSTGGLSLFCEVFW